MSTRFFRAHLRSMNVIGRPMIVMLLTATNGTSHCIDIYSVLIFIERGNVSNATSALDAQRFNATMAHRYFIAFTGLLLGLTSTPSLSSACACCCKIFNRLIHLTSCASSCPHYGYQLR